MTDASHDIEIAELLATSVPRVLDQQARDWPERPFLTVIGEGTQTARQCQASAARIANVLAGFGVKAGDAVVIMAPNGFAAIHAWFAVTMLSAVDVTINTAYRGQSLEHAINLVGANVVIADETFLDVLAASELMFQTVRTILWMPSLGAAPTHPVFSSITLHALHDLATEPTPPATFPFGRDIASIIFTSGTSGPAKGVMMPHAQAYVLARQAVDALRLTASDTYYCFHPLFHTAGKFIGVYAALLSGAHLVMDKRFDASRWLDSIREYGATATLAHGAMLEMIYAEPVRPDDVDNPLERFIAAPFPRAIASDFESRFRVRGIEVWGMTEINNPCQGSLNESLRPGSCGRVDATWTEFRIVDPETDTEVPTGEIGEFVVRPRYPWTMMQGYVGMPEKTLVAWRNLWFHTGDSGYCDDEGYVYFTDRLDDRIRRRAENISSYDIEMAALTYPAVAECSVVGVASRFANDDDIKICVVPRDGSQFDHMDFIRHLAGRLPHFMVPKYVELLGTLPRTPTNKVRKLELRRAGVTPTTWDRAEAGVRLRAL